ncbi:multidrug efflux pump subunit AcrB [Rhodothalassium salexigens DSM 2132]|uniref:Multidrug efflux pump subunit AcrB n=3 Tax=Rhodothalassium salexigens TaxID=1086 RepID=A0A4R2P844_RHOSA|nr:efflux RND transporter permease subunit [Rhodothalassium salexigens]MBB4212548.1 multidrug efflux pump subunit AcrB [Rhodothalassium salexigens DSM 2132]TCP31093.1 multidrug efflux pump subunit AcrB [Rhodothalassium salexigens DSM 2132]
MALDRLGNGRSLYNYPRLVVLILVLVLVAGMAALTAMPRLEDPHLKPRFATVITRLPGADAARVEALVTDPIERKLREVAEVDEISSVSRPGVSSVTVTLKDEVEDTEPAMARLRDKLGEVVGLPAGATEPVFDDNRTSALSAIVALKWRSPGAPNYAILGRHADQLDTRLKNIAGTDYTRIQGLPGERITVTVDADALAPLGLDTAVVARRLFQGDAKSAAGTLADADNAYVVEVDGSLDSLDRIRRVPLIAEASNGLLTVGDVAHVARGHADPPDTLALIDGVPAVVVGARMLETSRLDLWTAEVKALLDEFRPRLPSGVEARLIFEQAQYTDARLSGLMRSLIAGILIVFTLLLLTLGWRASAITGSVLPLAALAALAVLNLAGMQIQQMVVTGMIVGLGIMVDNAIVVTDEIQHRLLDGEPRGQAVARTVGKLWLPLMGSTATTVFAFMPIILMPGPAGEFVGGISYAVIASLIASYALAFTVIAALAGRLLRPGGAAGAGRRVWWRNGVAAAPLARGFRRALGWGLRHPRLTVALTMVLPVAGVILSGTLTEQFFPASDRNQFRIQLELPDQASIYETEAVVRAADRLVRARPGVVSAQWYMGETAAKFYYNMMSNRDGVGSFAEAMVTADDLAAVDRLIPDLQAAFDRRWPGVRTLVRKLEQGPPYPAPIEVRVVGPDLETLRDLGDQLFRQLMRVEAVTHARTTLAVGRPQVSVAADEDAVATLGLDLRRVADQLRAAVDGESGGAILEETEQVPVLVRTGALTRGDLDGLRRLDLTPADPARGPDDGFLGVPLSAVAEVTVTPSVSAIPRRNGERVNTLQGYVENGVLPGDVLTEFQRHLATAGIDVPPGYRIEFGGESEERNEAVGKLMSQVGVLLMLMVIAIVLTFNSFRLSAITFVSAGLAAGLGLLSLWVSQNPMGFVVIVGVMGLLGLAINDTIVILVELKNDARARAGDDAAIVDAVGRCGRHIVSTSLTTVGGFTPLILAGSDFWSPFAFAIAGGAGLSMILFLFFTPAAFKLAVRRRPLAFDRPGAAEPAALSPGAAAVDASAAAE